MTDKQGGGMAGLNKADGRMVDAWLLLDDR